MRLIDAEALKARFTEELFERSGLSAQGIIDEAPTVSADAEPTVIRSKTLMPTKDFKEWAKRIREENPNVIVIPCDAEVVSANSVVRCKDCKQRRVEGDCTHYYYCDFLGPLCGDNEYCSFGERREP